MMLQPPFLRERGRGRFAPAGHAAGTGVDFPCEKIAPALSASLSLASLGIHACSASESLPPHATPVHPRRENEGQ
jgi:hypothetical protein